MLARSGFWFCTTVRYSRLRRTIVNGHIAPIVCGWYRSEVVTVQCLINAVFCIHSSRVKSKKVAVFVNLCSVRNFSSVLLYFPSSCRRVVANGLLEATLSRHVTTHKNTNTERLSLALTVVKEVQSKNVTSDKTLTDFPSSGKRRGVEPGRVYFFDKIGHVKFHVNICDTNFASFAPC